MAAKGQPRKSTKMTRLSELCYDTHALCETCRGKVCDYNSFCEECDSWTKDFRKTYMRHQRTLYLKRVSKSNAKSKAKSPPVVDYDASTASIEFHVSPPMVMLPLDPHLVDAEVDLGELGYLPTIDSVVEIQSQPKSPPPPPPPPSATLGFDANLMNAALAKLNHMLDEFRGRRTPPRENVGSDRRSLSAGPSDIARPNPIAQVSDTAPQGPDSAPGPSTATHVPPPLGPSLHDAPSDGEYVSTRGRMDEWEHVRYGSRHVSPPERLRDDLERTHAEISQLRDYNDFCRAFGRAPPDHYYRDLDILHSRCDQLSLALAESRQAFAPSCRGRSPVIASPRVAPPSDAPRPPRPDSSSLQGPRLLPWPGPSSQDRRRPSDASSDLPHRSRLSRSAITTDSFLAPNIATIGDSVQGSPLLLTKWESPQWVPPLRCEWDSLQGGPLLQTNGIRIKGFPLSTANGIRFKGVPLSKAIGVRLKGVPLSKANGSRLKGFPLSKANGSCLKGFPLSKENGSRLKGSPLSNANGIRFKGVPFSNANGIRLKGVPLSNANGIRLKGFPLSKENGSRLKGSPLSNANGIRFKGVPFSNANGIRFKGFPLSTATVFRFKGLCFTSTSALIRCFVW